MKHKAGATRKKQSPLSIEQAVIGYARDFPQSGQAKAAVELERQGYPVSASGVRYIWKKHGLETAYKRLKAFARDAEGGVSALTVRQREIIKRGDVSRRIARFSPGDPARAEMEAGDRRERIVQAAAELFVEHGYGGTSIRDIADRVGMLPGSIYHYFPAKEDLFVAIHHEGFRSLIKRTSEVLRQSAGADPWKRLELACAEHITDVAAGTPISRVTATALFAIHEDRLQRRLKADRENYDQMFRQLIAELNLPAHIDRTIFRLNLLGALNWSHVWYRPGKSTPREIAARTVAILKTKT